jgi:hypothetical protein
MNSRRIACMAALAMLAMLIGTDRAGATDSDKCSAAKMKAASKYVACRLKADALAKSKGGSPDYTKCDEGQSGSWTKIEEKYTTACPTSGDQAALQADMTAATSCVATELAGPSGSCDTSAEILCGNGVVDAGEDCDQSALGGATCASATAGVKAYGTLACGADCQAFDTSGCIECPVSGTVVDGKCWVLSNFGDSCTAACALNGMVTDDATLSLVPAVCSGILAHLGVGTGFINGGGPPDVGCWTPGPGSLYFGFSVTQQGSYASGQRACACQ